MSVTRSGSRRTSSHGLSNGHRAHGDHPARGDHHTWHSSSEMEATNLQSRFEELQAQVGRLEKEREQFSSLFEAMPSGYVVMDENGIIKESNRQLETILRIRRGAMVPGPLARMVVPADVPVFLEHLRQCK